jgi:CheY-like chemotaxis protein
MYILIVEDDRANRQLFRYQAEEVEFEVDIDVAWTGWDALARIARRRPDLLLVDLGLPMLDGLGLLKRLAESPETAGIPVLVITARDLDPREDRLLRSLGVAQVFQKGRYDTEALVRAITRFRPGPYEVTDSPHLRCIAGR